MSSTYKLQSVSQTVWRWRESAPPGTKPAVASHRRKAILQSLVMFSVGCVFLFALHYRIAGMIVLILGGIVLLSGLFVPPVFLWIEKLGALLGLGVGMALTWILLVPFFYLCFTPMRLFHRMTGKDPLFRKCPSSEPTYWVPRPPVTDVSHYRKQH